MSIVIKYEWLPFHSLRSVKADSWQEVVNIVHMMYDDKRYRLISIHEQKA